MKNKKKEKIFIFSNASDLYGAPKALYLLLSRWKFNQFAACVVFPSDGPLVAMIRNLNIQVIILKRKPRLNVIEKFKYILSLCMLFIIEKPKLVYVNTVAHIEPIIIAKILSIKLIVHVREHFKWLEPTSFLSNLRIFILLNFPNYFVCVSKATANIFLKKHIAREKVIIVYDGIDHNEYNISFKLRAEQRKVLGITDNIILVGFIGQMFPRKGLDIFFRAAEIVIKKNSFFKFIVLGGPLDCEYVKDEILPLIEELKLKDYVIFEGFQANMLPYFSAIDIFVNTSRREPFAMVNLESMAFSLPVIATDAGGNAESVIDNVTGFIVPVDDVEMVSNKIISLGIDSSLRKSFGLAGRKRVEDYFTVERYSKETADVILKSLDNAESL